MCPPSSVRHNKGKQACFGTNTGRQAGTQGTEQVLLLPLLLAMGFLTIHTC